MAHLTQRRSRGPVPPAEHRVETIIAPAGKLGLVIGLEDDDKPPAIVKIIRKDSPLVDRMFLGDQILSVDGEDTTHFDHKQLTELLTARASSQRALVVRHDPAKKAKQVEQMQKQQFASKARMNAQAQARRQMIVILLIAAFVAVMMYVKHNERVAKRLKHVLREGGFP